MERTNETEDAEMGTERKRKERSKEEASSGRRRGKAAEGRRRGEAAKEGEGSERDLRGRKGRTRRWQRESLEKGKLTGEPRTGEGKETELPMASPRRPPKHRRQRVGANPSRAHLILDDQ